MPYLIDGHNLIPKVPGLSLEAADDEMQLVEMLQEFCRLSRKDIEVHFDNAPPGQPRARLYGRVTARFARTGETADEMISARLRRLGATARNWTVVSSDRSVQASARGSRAQVLPSEAFARLMVQTLEGGGQRTTRAGEIPADAGAGLSDPAEIEDWLRLFGGEDGDESTSKK